MVPTRVATLDISRTHTHSDTTGYRRYCIECPFVGHSQILCTESPHTHFDCHVYARCDTYLFVDERFAMGTACAQRRTPLESSHKHDARRTVCSCVASPYCRTLETVCALVVYAPRRYVHHIQGYPNPTRKGVGTWRTELPRLVDYAESTDLCQTTTTFTANHLDQPPRQSGNT